MGVQVAEVMTRAPKTVGANELASAAVHTMEQFGVIALPALDADGRVVGVAHLHDLMRAGAA
jgi:arabinose-5-phosphate isomerase